MADQWKIFRDGDGAKIDGDFLSGMVKERGEEYLLSLGININGTGITRKTGVTIFVGHIKAGNLKEAIVSANSYYKIAFNNIVNGIEGAIGSLDVPDEIKATRNKYFKYASDSGYDRWIDDVDSIFEGEFGLSIYDLPDLPWVDYYEDGFDPESAIEAAMEDNPDFFSL